MAFSGVIRATFVFDLWVLLFPICLVLTIAFIGVIFLFQFPVPREFGPWFGVIVAGNVLQLGVLAVLWYREYAQSKDDSVVFWGKVLKRYLFLGGALYYLYHLRGWPPKGTDRETYQRKFWLPFVRSQLTHIIRYINRVWIYVFAFGLLTNAVMGLLRLDLLVVILFRVIGAAVAIGVPASSYLAFMLVRDAVVRWMGSPSERDIAMKIFGSYYWLYLFHWYMDAETYFQTVSALESSDGR